jgi:hypothetical protein
MAARQLARPSSVAGTFRHRVRLVGTASFGGYVIMHPSGAYLSFTQEGADLFA